MPRFLGFAVYEQVRFDDVHVEQAGWIPSHFSLALRHWSQARETLCRFAGRISSPLASTVDFLFGSAIKSGTILQLL